MANILVVGPHPDDQEIGMGGTIARLADQGHRVRIVDLTDGSPTPHGDRSTRLPEAQRALACLQPSDAGKPRIERVLLDLPNRRLEHTLEARHLVAGQIRDHQASIVFCPHPLDAHPDHIAATRIVEDARFDAKLTKQAMPGDGGKPPLYPRWLFYYYCSHLRRVPDPNFLIDITGYEQAKRRSIEAYVTQFGGQGGSGAVGQGGSGGSGGVGVGVGVGPGVGGESFSSRMEATAMFFGSRIGTAYAEPFFTYEPLGLRGLDGLVG